MRPKLLTSLPQLKRGTFVRCGSRTRRKPAECSSPHDPEEIRATRLTAMTEVIDLEDSPTPGECRAMLHTLFPDMCPDYLEKVASDHYATDRAVNYVLDLLQRGKTYDKVRHGNKRKREPTPPETLDEASALVAKYDNPVRHQQPKSGVYLDFAYVTALLSLRACCSSLLADLPLQQETHLTGISSRKG